MVKCAGCATGVPRHFGRVYECRLDDVLGVSTLLSRPRFGRVYECRPDDVLGVSTLLSRPRFRHLRLARLFQTPICLGGYDCIASLGACLETAPHWAIGAVAAMSSGMGAWATRQLGKRWRVCALFQSHCQHRQRLLHLTVIVLERLIFIRRIEDSVRHKGVDAASPAEASLLSRTPSLLLAHWIPTASMIPRWSLALLVSRFVPWVLLSIGAH